MDTTQTAQRQIEQIYHDQSRRILATLIRVLGGFDLAEEAMHEAFAAALEQWPRDGVPDNPRAWLVKAARFKAIDRIRRRVRFDDKLSELALELENESDDGIEDTIDAVEDDQLRLIFTCCHPALSRDAQIALTLREMCGLTTEEVASPFLIKPTTIAQRIVRAKRKIRDAGIPYEVPPRAELPERLDSVLQVVYLVFNEGYSASAGDTVTRRDISGEAIRLGRLLADLLPEPEAIGLLALMLLQESRRDARVDAKGDLVLLADQDRSLWNGEQIAEGTALVRRAFAGPVVSSYSLQAAIAALHAEAPTADATDWHEIVGLYDVLARVQPSPVVDLNRAVALAMRDGPEAGLAAVDALLVDGQLRHYHLAHAARADMCRRLGRTTEARQSYEQALRFAAQKPERRFLQTRLDELK